MTNSIAVIDDDPKIGRMITLRFKKQGYDASEHHSGESALEWLSRHDADLVLLDVKMPGMDGVEVLRQILKLSDRAKVIMISAHADVQLAVECLKIGAIDFLEKPFEWTVLDAKVKQVFHQMTLEAEVSNLKTRLGQFHKDKALIGRSRAMRRVFQEINFAAESDANVLIQGESGTGKELVARAIHFKGLQKDGPFVAVNCAAIPEALLESELFGHEKGSFTGAYARRLGRFEQAEGGTIFLDEIGDLPASLQAKLLRVIQEREVDRVGGTEPIAIRVRFIVATHRDLRSLVQQQVFREDLYFRIHVFPINVPALRDRKEDIPELVQFFLNQNYSKADSVSIDPEALKILMEYRWPGNIRELENFMIRLALVNKSLKRICPEDIKPLLAHSMSLCPDSDDNSGNAAIQGGAVVGQKKQFMSHAEKSIFEKALKEARGNVTQAARLIGVSRDTFYRKIKKYGLQT